MISRMDVINYSKNHPDCWYRIEGNCIIDNEDNKKVCDLDTFVDLCRKKLHCDFESIYSCHGLLQTTLRCRQCGTVIFAYEDDRDEPNLCCPVCTDYKTSFEFWTPDEIRNDRKKQDTIKFLEEMEREQIEADKRYQKRHKYDWQIGEFTLRITKNRKVSFELECDNLFRSGLQGLRLNVHIWKRDETINDLYSSEKHFYIPLSLSCLRVVLQVRKRSKLRQKEKVMENNL